jgi:hypothetical protein
MSWKCPACGLLNNDDVCLKCVCGYDNSVIIDNTGCITSPSHPRWIYKVAYIALCVVVIIITPVTVFFLSYALHSGGGYDPAIGYPSNTESLTFSLLFALPFTFLAIITLKLRRSITVTAIAIYIVAVLLAFILSLPNKKVTYSFNDVVSFINNDIGISLLSNNNAYKYEHYDEGEVGWSDIYYINLKANELNKLMSLDINWSVSNDKNNKKHYIALIKHKGKQYTTLSVRFTRPEPLDVEFRLYQQKKSYY